MDAMGRSTPSALTSSPVSEDPESERLLTEDVERLATRLGATLHALGGGGSAGRAVDPFLQANGIIMAQPPHVSRAVGAATAMTGGGGGLLPSPGLAEALKTDMLHARTLLWRLDGERRHHRKQLQWQRRETAAAHAAVQVAQREATESRARVRALESQLAAAKTRARAAEDVADSLTVEAMRLRKFVRALPSPHFANGLAVIEEEPGRGQEVATALDLVPDRRFGEAFQDKMSSIVFKRRFRRASALHQQACERCEALSMEAEDTAALPPRLGTAAVSSSAAFLTAGGGGLHVAASAPTATAAVLRDAHGGPLAFPFQLPFSPTTSKDESIKAMLYHSRFAEPLNSGRDHLLRLSTRLKSALDTGLRALYSVHQDTLRSGGGGAAHADAAYQRRAFEQQLQKLQSAHRELLFSLVSTTNSTVTGVLEVEREKRSSAAAAAAAAGRRQTRDVATMAMDTSAADCRVHLVEERVRQLRLGALETENACARRLEQAEAETRGARKEALHILRNLEALGKAATDAARVAHHRAGAASASPSSQRGEDGARAPTDPFDSLRETVKSEADLEDPRLAVKVSEATDLAVSYLRRVSLMSTASCGPGALRRHPVAVPFTRVSETLADVAEWEGTSSTNGAAPAAAAHSGCPHVPSADAPARRAPRRLSVNAAAGVAHQQGGGRARHGSAAEAAAASPRALSAGGARPASQRRHTLPTLPRHHRRSDGGAAHGFAQQAITPNAPNAKGARKESAAGAILVGESASGEGEGGRVAHTTASVSVIELSFPAEDQRT